MGLALLDNPLILSILFYPQAAPMDENPPPGIIDGTLPAAEDVVLGYRFYIHEPHAPVILHFHGNGEIASDYDDIAPLYHRAGASLLVVDYRGYGWSTGQPKVSTLISDTEAVHDALPTILERAGVSSGSLFVMGRSLGSACAIHLAHEHPASFAGLIVESGFAHAIPLLARLGLPAERLAGLPDPIGNARKIAQVDLPLLVIHGERDSLIPVGNGQALYDASPSERKHMVRIPGAGHNDLLYIGQDAYFAAIREFIVETTP